MSSATTTSRSPRPSFAHYILGAPDDDKPEISSTLPQHDVSGGIPPLPGQHTTLSAPSSERRPTAERIFTLSSAEQSEGDAFSALASQPPSMRPSLAWADGVGFGPAATATAAADILQLSSRELWGMVGQHQLTMIFWGLVLALPSISLMLLFGELLAVNVDDWRGSNSTIMSSNPVVAGVIGEPFHKLASKNLWITFTELFVLCPLICCLTKTVVHNGLYFGLGAIRPHIWVPVLVLSAMGAGLFLCALYMHLAGRAVPRIAWMGLVFVGLFLSAFLFARRLERFAVAMQGWGVHFFLQTIVPNVIIFMYTVFIPFWFFGTSSLPLRLFLAALLHPVFELTIQLFLFHKAIDAAKTRPNALSYPLMHYASLIRMFGNFLLISFNSKANTTAAMLINVALLSLGRFFQTELLFLIYVRICRMDRKEAIARVTSANYRHVQADFVNGTSLVEICTTLVAGALAYAAKFDNGHNDPPIDALSLEQIATNVCIHFAIVFPIDALSDALAARKGVPWSGAWLHRPRNYMLATAWIVFAASNMFFFYFFPFLANSMVW